MKVSKITILLLIAGYFAIIAYVGAALVLNIETPTYLDINISTPGYVVNGVAWTPDIENKQFSACNIELTYSGPNRDVTITVAFWNTANIQIAQGTVTTGVTNGTVLINIPLTWTGSYTTDDISTGRIMIV